jgi:hypothetical protein
MRDRHDPHSYEPCGEVVSNDDNQSDADPFDDDAGDALEKGAEVAE